MATEEITAGGTVRRTLGVSEEPLPQGAQKALTFGLLLSAFRCTVQYVLLPFLLPWIGLAASIPRWVVLVLAGISIASLTRNGRHLFRVHHQRRWSYLALASVVATVLLIFVVMDLRAMMG